MSFALMEPSAAAGFFTNLSAISYQNILMHKSSRSQPAERKKIAIATLAYNSRGGIEKVTQQYARILHSRGHEVHIWSAQTDMAPEDTGLHFHDVKTYCGKGWLNVLVCALLMKAKLPVADYDAVLVMGTAALSKDTIIVAHSVHRHWYHFSLSRLPKFSLKWWLKLCNPLHYLVMLLESIQYSEGFYRSVIAVSEPTKQEVAKNYHVPLNKIGVVPNGALTAVLTPDSSVRKEVRSSLGIADNQYLLCMMVNELERKGVREALEAMKNLRQYPVKMLIAGRFDQATCARLVTDAGLADRVMVRPSTPDVKRYLWASDLYVLPTKYEAWNVSIMEAQAAGLPVVTTRLGQADLVIAPEESGYLLSDPSDVNELVQAIKRWIDRDDKQEMSLCARQQARMYDWENMIDRLEHLISEHDVAAVAN